MEEEKMATEVQENTEENVEREKKQKSSDNSPDCLLYVLDSFSTANPRDLEPDIPRTTVWQVSWLTVQTSNTVFPMTQ